MNNFTYQNPTKIHFGKDVIQQLGAELTRLKASCVLLVYGGKSAKENGVLYHVITQLNEANIRFIDHGGARGNPVLSHARSGIEKAKQEQVDLILAVGGGSVIDESKSIALGADSEEDIWEYYAKRAQGQTALPLVTVLTLPATGSEMNGIAVLTNDETQEKNALVLPPLLNPQISFLDPETTYSLPPHQTAFACVDILSHLMEAYLTTSADELIINDAQIEGVALSTIEAMRRIMKNPSNYTARAAFMWSATLAWNGLAQVGIPNWGMPCHALEMPLSGVHDIAHGAGLSIIIPSWIRAMGPQHQVRIQRFGHKILGLAPQSSLEEIAAELTTYYRSLGSPVSCTEAGVPDPDIERLTELAFLALEQRGMKGYSKDIVRKIYTDSI